MGKKKSKQNIAKDWAFNTSVPARNLPKSDLAAVIFGCKGHTIQECFSKQLFGLPYPHFSYVKKISPGLKLFLFNYSDRKLHGIFEAAGPGQLNIDSYAWTDGSMETEYPAQVEFKISMRCNALTEDQFYPIIAKNYYEPMLFWFELDQAQTTKLVKLFSSSPMPSDRPRPRTVPAIEARTSPPVHSDGPHPCNPPSSEASTSVPLNYAHAPYEQKTWSSLFKDDTPDAVNRDDSLNVVSSEPAFPLSEQSNADWESYVPRSIDERGEPPEDWEYEWAGDNNNQLLIPPASYNIQSERGESREVCVDEWAEGENEWAGDNNNQLLIPPFSYNNQSERGGSREVCVGGWAEGENEWAGDDNNQLLIPPVSYNNQSERGVSHEVCVDEWAEGQNVRPFTHVPVHSVDGDSSMDQFLTPPDSSDFTSVVTNLLREVALLKENQMKQEEKISTLEKLLLDKSLKEFQNLQNQHNGLEAEPLPSTEQFEGVYCEPLKATHKTDDYVLVVGGFDGSTWLSTISSYSPLHDQLKSISTNTVERTYCAASNFHSEVYVIGGMLSDVWYDTVESYNPRTNKFYQQPSLNQKKGSLAAASLHDNLFAIGGGNGKECFSDVEILDLDIGMWMQSRPMLQKRFAPAAAETNGALYVVGGFDGQQYLETVERFDPREPAWQRIGSMKTKRGCHSLVAYNEKLYAIGGFNGVGIVPSVEVFDPRIGSWSMGEEMNFPRGNLGAVVMNGMIYAIGGINNREEVLDAIECYKEGDVWQVTNLKGVGKRCIFSAVVV